MRVFTKNRFGKNIMLRCLVDPGSQVSFMTVSTYKRLGLKGNPTKVEIKGINQNATAWSKHQVNIKLTSCQNKDTSIAVDLLIIDSITDTLPSTTFCPSSHWTHIQGLSLADPTYWEAGSIDILLGVNVYADILQGEVIKGPKDAPIAINTSFGWIILGKGAKQTKVDTFLTTTAIMEELNKNLIKFWETEEISRPKMWKPEDAQCEKHFEDTHIRLKNGQYQVRLPFSNKPTLGSSKESAIKRFQHLQRKFSQHPELRANYSKCLDEYLSLDHMEVVPETHRFEKNSYYIPHHAVYKESSTTKLRVVFDASAKTSNGKSLNEQLLTGPTLQPKLFATLLKWRKYKVAITADIEKMYRMIRIHPEDQKYQRIMWMDQNSEEQEFELKTVTFGTTSAPYLAIRTLLQLAEDEKEKWPLASKVAKTDFYVDDLLSGADTIQEAKELQHQCMEMLKSAKFNLRKWASNCKELLHNLPFEHVETKDFLQFDEHESVKTLGIQWIPRSDYFTFKIKECSNTDAPTKRKMLSEIASLYDPLGWISPVIIIAKILMQGLWVRGCSWDSKVDNDITEKWNAFKLGLQDLESIRIPRWVGFQTNLHDIQLHGFCDASMVAYAAVIYLRIRAENGNVTVHMLTSKTRVAPIKPVTLPRLELNGATLLANLLQTTVQDMQLEAIPIIAWTDSTIALQWIRSSPTRWKQYVANRIADIQERVAPECWRHVPTEYNPADIASRGLHAKELTHNKMWWCGPEWLLKTENEWPTTPINIKPIELEAKRKILVMISTNVNNDELFHKYSSFRKLQRIIARLRRFLNNTTKDKSNRMLGPLTVKELQMAANTIFKQIQKICFHDEYAKLINGHSISNKSKLLTLAPFVDEHGVIRVGGRLENATLAYNRKHPIILPSDHIVTNLLIDDIHKYTLHGGRGLVVNTSRHLYWILNAQRVVSKRLNNCTTCIRHRQQTMSQLMGNLPSARINISKPFTNVGIDYAGPILLKTSPHRSIRQYKGYFCIFVCMATKAIHLELVSDLTSVAFLAALRRFTSRRGLCKNIYSDCGTNFKGAEVILDKEVRKAIKEVTSEAAKELLEQHSIVWHFNPPASPHFGGLWEAGVKSVKYHLRRVIGKAVFTYEEYATLLSQVEACLNSRPLCPTANSLEDLEVLTPGHFLIGQPLNAIPEPNLTDDCPTLSRRWKHIQYMTQQFWNKWSKDYLNNLQQRRKWYHKTPNLKIGDIVILKEDNVSPTSWPLARITEIFPGKDGLTRVVEVRTATTTLKRPIAKICQLPMNDQTVHDEH